MPPVSMAPILHQQTESLVGSHSAYLHYKTVNFLLCMDGKLPSIMVFCNLGLILKIIIFKVIMIILINLIYDLY